MEAFRQLMAFVHESQTDRRWTEQHWVVRDDLAMMQQLGVLDSS